MKNKRVLNSLIIIQGILTKNMTIDEGKNTGGFSLFAKHAIKYYAVGGSGVLVNLEYYMRLLILQVIGILHHRLLPFQFL